MSIASNGSLSRPSRATCACTRETSAEYSRAERLAVDARRDLTRAERRRRAVDLDLTAKEFRRSFFLWQTAAD